jgi:hypothetical protein
MPRETFEAKTAHLKNIIAVLDRAYSIVRFKFTSAQFLLGCFHERNRLHGG